jgi:hypothetical protein
MNQTSDERERRHREEYRLDGEDMLGCTWTMDQLPITYGASKQDLLNERAGNLNQPHDKIAYHDLCRYFRRQRQSIL